MAADTIISRAPDARFLLAHPAHFIALGFGAGLAPRAPGTFGTLVGWAMFLVLHDFMGPIFIALLAVPMFFLGIWACERTGRDLGVQDHGAMVWDEIVAFLPLAALCFASVWMQLAAFVLFRLFDIWKPFPIRHFERNVKGGFGVMLDDLIAASYAYVGIILLTVAGHKLLRTMA
jgi:phosphatidylglycerophosphatase A